MELNYEKIKMKHYKCGIIKYLFMSKRINQKVKNSNILISEGTELLTTKFTTLTGGPFFLDGK